MGIFDGMKQDIERQISSRPKKTVTIKGPGPFPDLELPIPDKTYDPLAQGSQVKFAELQKQREKRIKELEAVENQLRGELTRKTSDVGTAIDKELAQLTQQVGFKTDEAMAQTSEQNASRGLLRSTFATDQLGDVQQQKLQGLADLRSQTDQKKLQVQDQQRQALNTIAQRRQQFNEQIRQADISNLQDIVSNSRIQQLQDEFATYVTNMQINSAQRGALMGTLGGLFSNLAFLGAKGSG